MYETMRNKTPRFGLGQIPRFTRVGKQEEQVWDGAVEGIVLSSSVLDMLSLKGL